MASNGQRELDRLKTRAAILAATAVLMREEGYAAVSSRRVAERAGLKSQLVHYHFGTMEELFLALLQQTSAKFFTEHLEALTSAKPLEALWQFSVNNDDIQLALEFVAAGNHIPAIRMELARSTERVRAVETSLLSKAYRDLNLDAVECPPNVLAFLIASVSRAIVTEANTGVTEGHSEIIAFMEELFRRLQPKTRAIPARRVQGKG